MVKLYIRHSIRICPYLKISKNLIFLFREYKCYQYFILIFLMALYWVWNFFNFRYSFITKYWQINIIYNKNPEAKLFWNSVIILFCRLTRSQWIIIYIFGILHITSKLYKSIKRLLSTLFDKFEFFLRKNKIDDTWILVNEWNEWWWNYPSY